MPVLLFFASQCCFYPFGHKTLGNLTDSIRSFAIGFLNGGICPLPFFGDLAQFKQDLYMTDTLSLVFAFGDEFFMDYTLFDG